LGTKADALTHYWDIYDKGGSAKQANIKPLFAISQVTVLVAQLAITIDAWSLQSNISTAILMNPDYAKALKAKNNPGNSLWSEDKTGVLCYKEPIFVPDTGDL